MKLFFHFCILQWRNIVRICLIFDIDFESHSWTIFLTLNYKTIQSQELFMVIFIDFLPYWLTT